MGPLSDQTQGPEPSIRRARFEIDQIRGQNILNRTPTAGPDRSLTQRTREMTLDDQQTFLDVGNSALVR